MSIGSRIKQRREELGISQLELAQMLNVTRSAIGNYETDANSPKASIMYKVLEVLQCDANYIFQDGAANAFPVQELIETPLEKSLLVSFRSLNEEGQDKAIEYIDDLISSGKYIKISGDEVVQNA